MTRSIAWTASRLFLPLCLVSIGCSPKPQPVSARDETAVLAGGRIAPDRNAVNVAALDRLDHVDQAAATIKTIDVARDLTIYNMTNAETIAFKSSRFFFEGGGKYSIQLNLEQGNIENTGGNLDVAIQGAGFIPVKLADAQGGIGYTRAGNFTINNVGELVVAIGDGYRLVPPITLPTNGTSIAIGCDGTVQYVKAGQTAKSTAGQIKLANFPHPQSLAPVASSVFVATDSSGPAVASVPGTNGTGRVLPGFLESSNVTLTRETMRMQVLNEWRTDLLRAAGLRN